MTFSFDQMPTPEPSSIVGFSKNAVIRDSEGRDENTIVVALENPDSRYFLFAEGRVIVMKTETPVIAFLRDGLEMFKPVFDEAILLGNLNGTPHLAVPCRVHPESLEEPFLAYDMRGLLYSSAVSDEETGAIAQASAMLHWHNLNRFCGKCGVSSKSKIGGYRRDCPSCGSQIFPRTDPVAIMLPVHGDRCVMGRSPHFPPGWFSTLAGFVEPGETLEDAVRRETWEESGLQIGRVKYHASQPWPFPHSLMIGVHCEAISDEITRDEAELEDCRWFTRDEVKLMLREEHPDGFICPPNRAISSALIQHWVNS